MILMEFKSKRSDNRMELERYLQVIVKLLLSVYLIKILYAVSLLSDNLPLLPFDWYLLYLEVP